MKEKTVFFCSGCGYESPKWFGKCPACQEWNTAVEEKMVTGKKSQSSSLRTAEKPIRIGEITAENEDRIDSGIGELNRTLGGGIVPGSLVLIGGDPGIGKSTLALQFSHFASQDKPVLYVSAEESLAQIKLRASRLHVSSDNLYILSSNEISGVMAQIEKLSPKVVIVDSIQTVYSDDVPSTPGSVTQIKECTTRLMRLAKETGIAVFIVGHVTKDGAIAGPKVLEHIVDTVLYFEGERFASYRIIRTVKNRFGSTNEIGVFEMSDSGLKEVLNPSGFLLEGRPKNVPGTCVCPVMEGTRTVLAEIQALVAPTSYGIPKRMTSGIDYNRISLLIAVLEKRAGIKLSSSDAFINVIGGIKIADPAADLTAILAMASAYKDIPLGDKVIAFGEVGLTGDIRSSSNPVKRISEAIKLGFDTIIMPKQDTAGIKPDKNINIIKVSNIEQGIAAVL